MNNNNENGLVGKWLITYIIGEPTVGEVVGQAAPGVFMVSLVTKDTPSYIRLVNVLDMMDFRFYDSEEEMFDTYKQLGNLFRRETVRVAIPPDLFVNA